MKKNRKISIMISLSVFILFMLSFAQTPVELNGKLRVDGSKIVGEHGNPVQLMGMSMYWTIWGPQKYYTEETVDWLVEDWNVDLIRASMAVSEDEGRSGWIADKEKHYGFVETIIAAAVKNGIYVIIDWHTHEIHTEEAEKFFAYMAEKYKDCPNIIWEIFNEPTTQKWTDIAQYHEEVISVIREHSDNLILAGTRTWSQRVDEAAKSPLSDDNTAYVLHFYAGTHGSSHRKTAESAMEQGAAIFISEWGTTDADGGNKDSIVYTKESEEWIIWALDNNLSMANWSVCNLRESSAIIKRGVSALSGWDPETDLSESGMFVRQWIREINDEKYGEGPVRLVIKTEGPGSVEVSPQKEEYEKGDIVTLTAVEGENGKFLHWNGSVKGEERSTSVEMNSTKRITAKFLDLEAPLIVNGDFSDSVYGWTWYVNTSAEGKAKLTIENKQALADIEDSGTVCWSVQLFQGDIVLVNNYRYELKFEARADSPRDIVVAVKRNGGEYDEYAADTISLGTEFDMYKLEFVKTETDPDSRVEFNFGEFSSENVYLKNVEFELVDTLSAKKFRVPEKGDRGAFSFNRKISNSLVFLNFETKGIGNSVLKIFDLKSRLIQKNRVNGPGMHSVSFDLKKNSAGVYLVSLENAGKKVHCEKMLISR